MILRNIFITTLFLCYLSYSSAETTTIKYNIEYLKTLEKDTKKNFESLQQTLYWTSWLGGIPKSAEPLITKMGIIQEELDSIPLFKNVAKVKSDAFDTWIMSQTNETVDALFKEVDAQESLAKLIDMQNSKLHDGKQLFKKELTVDGAFERLFQSSHFKSKHKTIKS